MLIEVDVVVVFDVVVVNVLSMLCPLLLLLLLTLNVAGVNVVVLKLFVRKKTLE